MLGDDTSIILIIIYRLCRVKVSDPATRFSQNFPQACMVSRALISLSLCDE